MRGTTESRTIFFFTLWWYTRESGVGLQVALVIRSSALSRESLGIAEMFVLQTIDLRS